MREPTPVACTSRNIIYSQESNTRRLSLRPTRHENNAHNPYFVGGFQVAPYSTNLREQVVGLLLNTDSSLTPINF